MWSVLKQTNLNNIISSLDEHVNEEGNNYSVGQRQLFCLSRALLRRTTILIMDEATSSLDHESERLINDIIMKTPRTVVSIAHKLSNIINFDKIIVLDVGGEIKEIGSPKELMENKDSFFSQMIKTQMSS